MSNSCLARRLRCCWSDCFQASEISFRNEASLSRPFFEKAFGKDADEFKYLIEQPEEIIFHRENMKPYEEHFVTALSNV